MTRESRLVVSLDEVHAIRWVCAQCKSAISYQLDESIHLPSVCPACQAPLGAADAAEYHQFQAFVDALKVARRASRGTIGATLQLEFVDDPLKAT